MHLQSQVSYVSMNGSRTAANPFQTSNNSNSCQDTVTTSEQTSSDLTQIKADSLASLHCMPQSSDCCVNIFV